MRIKNRVKLVRHGKARRLRSKKNMKHKPMNGYSVGKWHSRTSLWNYKRLSRRKRLISNASRHANR